MKKERIGIVVATNRELVPFLEKFNTSKNFISSFETPDLVYSVYYYERRFTEIFLVESGCGEINAASATQFLIDKFNIDRIINYGVVGSLRESCPIKKVGLATKVVHYDFDISVIDKCQVGQYPGQRDVFITPKFDAIPREGFAEFICASADKFVGAGEPKRKLREQFGADICEMESAAILIVCNKNNKPCSMVKAVSDGIDEDGKAFEQNVSDAAKACIEAIMEFI